MIAARFELVVLDGSAWSENASESAFYELARLRCFNLVADGYFFPGLESFADVLFSGMVGDACHEVAAALCESDAEDLGSDFRILVEHLVEVAQSKEQQRVGRELAPNLEVLLHHGGDFLFVHSRKGAWEFDR